MQIRCYNCHRPFALSKAAVHLALDEITSQDLAHFNAVCPHCSRTNRVSRKDLSRAAPDWSLPARTEEPVAESVTEQAENSVAEGVTKPAEEPVDEQGNG
jgi:hypothetical protein